MSWVKHATVNESNNFVKDLNRFYVPFLAVVRVNFK